MEIHTKDKELGKVLKQGLKYVDKSQERIWSEYELRLLIQDELNCNLKRDRFTKDKEVKKT